MQEPLDSCTKRPQQGKVSNMALENAWSFLKMARPTQEHIDALPPIPEGHKRLYRGSKAGIYPLAPKGEDDYGYEGRWFHDNWKAASDYADYPGQGKEESLESERESGKKALMYVDVPEHIEPHVNSPYKAYQYLSEKYGIPVDSEGQAQRGVEQGKFTRPQVRYPLNVGVAQARKGSKDFWLDDSDDFNLKESVRPVHHWED